MGQQPTCFDSCSSEALRFGLLFQSPADMLAPPRPCLLSLQWLGLPPAAPVPAQHSTAVDGQLPLPTLNSFAAADSHLPHTFPRLLLWQRYPGPLHALPTAWTLRTSNPWLPGKNSQGEQWWLERKQEECRGAHLHTFNTNNQQELALPLEEGPVPWAHAICLHGNQIGKLAARLGSTLLPGS